MSLVRRALDRSSPVERRSWDSFLQPGQIPTNGQLGWGSFAGIPVSIVSAFANDAVWACVALLVDVISMLPVDVYRKTGGIRVPVNPTPMVVARPSPFFEREEWVGQVVHSLVTQGNAYGVILDRDRALYPTHIEIVDPGIVSVGRKGKFGPPTYNVDGEVMAVDDIFHVRGSQLLPGKVTGLSVIDSARQAIGLGLASEKYGAEFFGDGAHPTGIIKSNRQKLDETSSQVLKQRVMNAIKGREFLALGPDVDLQPWQADPGSAQLVEIRRLVAEVIARFFRIPPESIGAAGSGSSITYSNRDQRALDLLVYTVQPWLTRIEAAWTRQTPAPQFVKFNADALLRMDSLTRANVQSLKIRTGTMNPDEARALEDEPPIPDGKGQEFLWPPDAKKYPDTQDGAGSGVTSPKP